MMRATKRKHNPKRRVRFRGITAAAVDLGCDRSHLYRVLTGERESRSLMRRFREWQKSQTEEVA